MSDTVSWNLQMSVREGQLSDADILKRRAQETGDIVTVVPVTNSNHFQLITPGHEAWLPVLRTIRTALGLR